MHHATIILSLAFILYVRVLKLSVGIDNNDGDDLKLFVVLAAAALLYISFVMIISHSLVWKKTGTCVSSFHLQTGIKLNLNIMLYMYKHNRTTRRNTQKRSK